MLLAALFVCAAVLIALLYWWSKFNRDDDRNSPTLVKVHESIIKGDTLLFSTTNPALKQGHTGPQVRRLKEMLFVCHALSPSDLKGDDFGESVKRAVESFQRKWNTTMGQGADTLKVDGEAGPKTAHALYEWIQRLREQGEETGSGAKVGPKEVLEEPVVKEENAGGAPDKIVGGDEQDSKLNASEGDVRILRAESIGTIEVLGDRAAFEEYLTMLQAEGFLTPNLPAVIEGEGHLETVTEPRYWIGGRAGDTLEGLGNFLDANAFVPMEIENAILVRCSYYLFPSAINRKDQYAELAKVIRSVVESAHVMVVQDRYSESWTDSDDDRYVFGEHLPTDTLCVRVKGDVDGQRLRKRLEEYAQEDMKSGTQLCFEWVVASVLVPDDMDAARIRVNLGSDFVEGETPKILFDGREIPADQIGGSDHSLIVMRLLKRSDTHHIQVDVGDGSWDHDFKGGDAPYEFTPGDNSPAYSVSKRPLVVTANSRPFGRGIGGVVVKVTSKFLDEDVIARTNAEGICTVPGVPKSDDVKCDMRHSSDCFEGRKVSVPKGESSVSEEFEYVDPDDFGHILGKASQDGANGKDEYEKTKEWYRKFVIEDGCGAEDIDDETRLRWWAYFIQLAMRENDEWDAAYELAYLMEITSNPEGLIDDDYGPWSREMLGSLRELERIERIRKEYGETIDQVCEMLSKSRIVSLVLTDFLDRKILVQQNDGLKIDIDDCVEDYEFKPDGTVSVRVRSNGCVAHVIGQPSHGDYTVSGRVNIGPSDSVYVNVIYTASGLVRLLYEEGVADTLADRFGPVKNEADSVIEEEVRKAIREESPENALLMELRLRIRLSELAIMAGRIVQACDQLKEIVKEYGDKEDLLESLEGNADFGAFRQRLEEKIFESLPEGPCRDFPEHKNTLRDIQKMFSV
jgi:hypothetical protein